MFCDFHSISRELVRTLGISVDYQLGGDDGGERVGKRGVSMQLCGLGSREPSTDPRYQVYLL